MVQSHVAPGGSGERHKALEEFGAQRMGGQDDRPRPPRAAGAAFLDGVRAQAATPGVRGSRTRVAAGRRRGQHEDGVRGTANLQSELPARVPLTFTS